MSRELINAELKGFDGPIASDGTRALHDILDVFHASGSILEKVCSQIGGYLKQSRPITGDYEWFWAQHFALTSGEMAVLIPWFLDHERKDGSHADRAVAVYFSGNAKTSEIEAILQKLVAGLKKLMTENPAAQAKPAVGGTCAGNEEKNEEKKVTVKPFFSQLYVDEELERLSGAYQIWQCDGEQRLSTLGWAEVECFAAKLLVLVRASVGRKISLAGVKKSELEYMAEDAVVGTYGEWCLDDMIRDGFLRERTVEGEAVIFPTEKLLKNQKIPKF